MHDGCRIHCKRLISSTSTGKSLWTFTGNSSFETPPPPLSDGPHPLSDAPHPLSDGPHPHLRRPIPSSLTPPPPLRAATDAYFTKFNADLARSTLALVGQLDSEAGGAQYCGAWEIPRSLVGSLEIPMGRADLRPATVIHAKDHPHGHQPPPRLSSEILI